jgi:hypothetical protein
MRKLLLPSAVFLFFTGCNQPSTDTPDAERVIRDTVAQNIFESLQKPSATLSERVEVVTSQTDKPQAQSQPLTRLLQRLQHPPQHFTIDNRTASDVKTANGTVLCFAANSFCTPQGETINNPVEIEVKECYRTADLLSENLSTSVNGNAFESKAAIYVKAFANGKTLEFKKGEQMEIEFPFEVKKQGWNIYTAVGNEWMLQPEKLNAKATFSKPEFLYDNLGLKEYLLQRIQYPDYAKANELSAKVEATIHIDEFGKVTLVGTSSDYFVFREEVNNRLKNLPDWKPAMYANRPISSVVKLNIHFNLREKLQIQVTVDPNEITYLPSDKNGDVTKQNNHIALCATTGWICIGTPPAKQNPAADVVVLSDVNTDVRLIKKGRNCIVSAQNFTGYSRTLEAGVNTDVDVLAIKYEEGKIYCSIQPLHLRKQNVITPNWKLVTESELANLLNSYPKQKG